MFLCVERSVLVFERLDQMGGFTFLGTSEDKAPSKSCKACFRAIRTSVIAMSRKNNSWYNLF